MPFTEKERQIFQYFDGNRDVWADPIAIRRRLYMACANFDAMLKQSKLDAGENPAPEDLRLAAEAQEAITEACRVAFEMPFNRSAPDMASAGADEEDVIRAFNSYRAFLKKKEKNTGSLPPSSAPTTAGPSDPPPPTTSTSACG